MRGHHLSGGIYTCPIIEISTWVFSLFKSFLLSLQSPCYDLDISHDRGGEGSCDSRNNREGPRLSHLICVIDRIVCYQVQKE
jgi:hypothetical protein